MENSFEGRILTGKVVNSFRKERQLNQQLTAQKPIATPNIDKEKIRKILSQLKKMVKFTASNKPLDLHPLDLKRLPTRPALLNPEAKKVKLSVQDPKKDQDGTHPSSHQQQRSSHHYE